MSEEIIDKVRKLNAKAENLKALGSEQEAQVFAEAVNRLLMKHKLEMSEIDWTEVHKKEPVIKQVLSWEDHGMPNKRSRILWSEQLCRIVARAHSCDRMVRTGTNMLVLVGRKSDIEIAEFVTVTLCRSAEKIADQEYVKYFYECRDRGDVKLARGFRAAFLDGFVQRIGERFAEIRRSVESANNSGTTLIRLKTDAQDVAQFLAGGNYSMARSLEGRGGNNREGHARGRSVANSMNLGADAIKTGNNKQLP